MSDDLLRKALADRDARPWRYYRFEWDDAKKWLEKVADERDALREEVERLKVAPPASSGVSRNAERAHDIAMGLIEVAKTEHPETPLSRLVIQRCRTIRDELAALLAAQPSAPKEEK